MKLALFVDTFPVKSQTFVLNQIEGLLALGLNLTVLSLHKGDDELLGNFLTAQHDNSKLLNIIYLLPEPKSRFEKLFWRAKQTLKGLFSRSNKLNTLKALNPKYGQQAKSLMLSSIIGRSTQPIQSLQLDIVLCHFGPNGVVADKLNTLNLFSATEEKKTKIATIFHGYDISVKAFVEQQYKDYQSLFKNGALMLPISHLWREKLIALHCPENKINVHRMGVDLTKFTFEPSQLNDKLTIFTVARFTEKKGLVYALKAVALLKEKIKFTYVLAGYGEQSAELHALAKTLGLENNVQFIGALTSEQVAEHMIKADVFLQPSITAENGDMEGVPVAIMEAMAVGTAVISTFHSGIPELITHNEQGLLAEEKNPEAIADNLLLLHQNHDLHKKLVHNARARIEEIADVSKLNKQLIKTLEKLL